MYERICLNLLVLSRNEKTQKYIEYATVNQKRHLELLWNNLFIHSEGVSLPKDLLVVLIMGEWPTTRQERIGRTSGQS